MMTLSKIISSLTQMLNLFMFIPIESDFVAHSQCVMIIDVIFCIDTQCIACSIYAEMMKAADNTIWAIAIFNDRSVHPFKKPPLNLSSIHLLCDDSQSQNQHLFKIWNTLWFTIISDCTLQFKQITKFLSADDHSLLFRVLLRVFVARLDVYQLLSYPKYRVLFHAAS